MAIKRVLHKLSGEYLAGGGSELFDSSVLNSLAIDIGKCVASGVEVAIVVGGGNILRGKELAGVGFSRITGDHMGLIATNINGLALGDILKQNNVAVRILSSIPMKGIIDGYSQKDALAALSNKEVLICTSGTGNPLFTTDTGACLRTIEIGADVLLKATKVNGVYTKDPVKHKDAKHYKKISYDEVLQKELGVIDLTAICLCKENKMPIRIFDIAKENSLIDAVSGKDIGTYIYEDNK